jgi:hypothetical protein
MDLTAQELLCRLRTAPGLLSMEPQELAAAAAQQHLTSRRLGEAAAARPAAAGRFDVRVEHLNTLHSLSLRTGGAALAARRPTVLRALLWARGPEAAAAPPLPQCVQY